MQYPDDFTYFYSGLPTKLIVQKYASSYLVIGILALHFFNNYLQSIRYYHKGYNFIVI